MASRLKEMHVSGGGAKQLLPTEIQLCWLGMLHPPQCVLQLVIPTLLERIKWDEMLA